jgi:hypothetical protein
MKLVTRASLHSNPSHTQLCHAASIVVRLMGTAGTAVAVQGYDIGRLRGDPVRIGGTAWKDGSTGFGLALLLSRLLRLPVSYSA